MFYFFMKDFFELKILDKYIIKKYLGTFFFALILIISVAVIFDLSEKIDDFLEKGATIQGIIFKYYLNFIPYFAVLFSSLFTFIAVIFFTSKMTYNSEIIAILNSGMSFGRMLRPFMISALILSSFSFCLSNFVLPHANKVRLEFEEAFLRSHPVYFEKRNVHKQLGPNLFVYLETYTTMTDVGYKFSIETIDSNKLQSKLIAEYIKWDSVKNKWNLHNYYVREINGTKETIHTGLSKDTTLSIKPVDFKRRDNFVETMSISELNNYIHEQQKQGADKIETLIIERDKRIAFPFSTFILTLIGVSLSTRKVRGGVGLHIGIGLLLCFTYIFFLQFSSQFAISGALSSGFAAWIPNIIYAIIAIFLVRMAPK
jgi:lipopolysaccharide export system permease protein